MDKKTFFYGPLSWTRTKIRAMKLFLSFYFYKTTAILVTVNLYRLMEAHTRFLMSGSNRIKLADFVRDRRKNVLKCCNLLILLTFAYFVSYFHFSCLFLDWWPFDFLSQYHLFHPTTHYKLKTPFQTFPSLSILIVFIRPKTHWLSWLQA